MRLDGHGKVIPYLIGDVVSLSELLLAILRLHSLFSLAFPLHPTKICTEPGFSLFVFNLNLPCWRDKDSPKADDLRVVLRIRPLFHNAVYRIRVDERIGCIIVLETDGNMGNMGRVISHKNQIARFWETEPLRICFGKHCCRSVIEQERESRCLQCFFVHIHHKTRTVDGTIRFIPPTLSHQL